MMTASLFRPGVFTRLRLGLLLLVLAAGAVLSQTSGNSDPAGFLSVAVNGTSGVGANRITYLGLGLTRPVAYQRTANAIGPTSITDSGAAWTTDQFAGANGPHFVEITSVNGSTTAAGVGTTYSIVSNTNTTLTLASNLAAGITAPVGYKIRKHWTIASVFGPNDESGLQGGTAVTADLVQLWTGAALDSYYYQTTPSTGWRRVGDPATDMGGTTIPFYSAVVITRQQSANVIFALNGTVKSGQTAIPIVAGDNYVGNVYPTNLTLANSNLYTGNIATGLAGGDAATADQVRIWNGTTFDVYYFQTTGVGGTGWRKVGAPSADAGDTVIDESSGFVINRRSSPNFNWVVPETLTGGTGTPTPAPTATRLLGRHPGVVTAGECADGKSALEAVESLQPDLLLLDIQMPGVDGFGVAEELGPNALPIVVFVTAFDEHAIHAFEACALDYLLKRFLRRDSPRPSPECKVISPS